MIKFEALQLISSVLVELPVSVRHVCSSARLPIDKGPADSGRSGLVVVSFLTGPATSLGRCLHLGQ